MYCEIISKDDTGEFVHVLFDTMFPVDYERPRVEVQDMTGLTHSRIVLDTLDMIDIIQNTGQSAVLENGKPKIIDIAPSQYIMDNYELDTDVQLPAGQKLPPGSRLRRIKKKAG